MEIILAFPQGIIKYGLITELQRQKWSLSDAHNVHELVKKVKDAPSTIVILSEEFVEQKMAFSVDALVRFIVRQVPKAKILLWSNSLRSALDYKSRIPHILGHIYNTDDSNEVVKACQLVHVGRRYVSRHIEELSRKFLSASENTCLLFTLSPREKEVFRLISLGMSVKEIAERLVISTKTVNTFRYRLFKKMQVVNDVQLAHLAIKAGFIEPQVNEETFYYGVQP